MPDDWTKTYPQSLTANDVVIFGRPCAGCGYVCLEDWKLCPMCGCASRDGRDPKWHALEVSRAALYAIRGASDEATKAECCLAERGGGLVCTLPKGHAGRHEAWGVGTFRPRYLIESWEVLS